MRRELVVHETSTEVREEDRADIQAVFTALVGDGPRTAQICGDVHSAVSTGRTCLVLTQRKDHIDSIVAGLAELGDDALVLRGGLGKKARAAVSDAIADSASRHRHRPRRHRVLPRRRLRLARARHLVPRVPAGIQGTSRPVRRTTPPLPRGQTPRRAPRLRRRPNPRPGPDAHASASPPTPPSASTSPRPAGGDHPVPRPIPSGGDAVPVGTAAVNLVRSPRGLGAAARRGHVADRPVDHLPHLTEVGAAGAGSDPVVADVEVGGPRRGRDAARRRRRRRHDGRRRRRQPRPDGPGRAAARHDRRPARPRRRAVRRPGHGQPRWGDGRRAAGDARPRSGITPDAVDAEIRSSMETVVVAHDAAGRPLHLDVHAAAADRILAVNRIKPHTGFRGPIESGCTKMIVVGFGKQPGAAQFHASGAGRDAATSCSTASPRCAARGGCSAGWPRWRRRPATSSPCAPSAPTTSAATPRSPSPTRLTALVAALPFAGDRRPGHRAGRQGHLRHDARSQRHGPLLGRRARPTCRRRGWR